MRKLPMLARALFVSTAANAQTLSKRPVSRGAVTPAEMAERLEKAAVRTREQAPMMSDGYLQTDFAIRRNNFNLYKLPGTPPDFVKADNDPMPAKDAVPNMPALKVLLTREYLGFERPASLRQLARDAPVRAGPQPERATADQDLALPETHPECAPVAAADEDR